VPVPIFYAKARTSQADTCLQVAGPLAAVSNSNPACAECVPKRTPPSAEVHVRACLRAVCGTVGFHVGDHAQGADVLTDVPDCRM
jgi:hypothetical protein